MPPCPWAPAEARGTKRLVFGERAEEIRRVGAADQVWLVDGEACGHGEARPVPAPEMREVPDQREPGERPRLQQRDDAAIRPAEQDGLRADADDEVVLAIDHRVHRVVDRRPHHAGDEQHPGDGRQLARLLDPHQLPLQRLDGIAAGKGAHPVIRINQTERA